MYRAVTHTLRNDQISDLVRRLSSVDFAKLDKKHLVQAKVVLESSKIDSLKPTNEFVSELVRILR